MGADVDQISIKRPDQLDPVLLCELGVLAGLVIPGAAGLGTQRKDREKNNNLARPHTDNSSLIIDPITDFRCPAGTPPLSIKCKMARPFGRASLFGGGLPDREIQLINVDSVRSSGAIAINLVIDSYAVPVFPGPGRVIAVQNCRFSIQSNRMKYKLVT